MRSMGFSNNSIMKPVLLFSLFIFTAFLTWREKNNNEAPFAPGGVHFEVRRNISQNFGRTSEDAFQSEKIAHF